MQRSWLKPRSMGETTWEKNVWDSTLDSELMFYTFFPLNDYSTWDSSRNTQPPRQTTPSKNHLQFISGYFKYFTKESTQHEVEHIVLAVLNPNRMGVRNTHLPWKTDEKCRQVAETLTILRLHHMLSSAWHLRVKVYIGNHQPRWLVKVPSDRIL